MPGRPVSLPCASAIIAAPPSWRQTTFWMPQSCSPSSAARKLSPGTENTRCHALRHQVIGQYPSAMAHRPGPFPQFPGTFSFRPGCGKSLEAARRRLRSRRNAYDPGGPMTKHSILGISGSLRREATNRKLLARGGAALRPRRGHPGRPAPAALRRRPGGRAWHSRRGPAPCRPDRGGGCGDHFQPRIQQDHHRRAEERAGLGQPRRWQPVGRQAGGGDVGQCRPLGGRDRAIHGAPRADPVPPAAGDRSGGDDRGFAQRIRRGRAADERAFRQDADRPDGRRCAARWMRGRRVRRAPIPRSGCHRDRAGRSR